MTIVRRGHRTTKVLPARIEHKDVVPELTKRVSWDRIMWIFLFIGTALIIGSGFAKDAAHVRPVSAEPFFLVGVALLCGALLYFLVQPALEEIIKRRRAKK